MQKKHFSLEMRDENRFTMIFQIILGVLCFAIACYWLIYNLKTDKQAGSVWATIIFLAGFGAYLVWSGLGYGYRFIEFYDDKMVLKKNSFLSPVVILPGEVEKIEMFPLKFTLIFRSSKVLLTRFGVSDIEKVELIKDEIIKFAADHSIPTEIKDEL